MPGTERLPSTTSVHRKVLKLMGNRFEISVVSADRAWAEAAIMEAVNEITRIEQLLTTFHETSQTNRINQYAGIRPVEVAPEVIHLIQRSIRISHLTQGAFDLTYGSIDSRLWNFDPTMTTLPDPVTARQMVRLINYRNIVVDEEQSTVFLKEKGMRIGFGGIGKGYAAERAKAILQRQGVTSGIVNAAGDLTTWGMRPDGHPWTIGIADPNTKHHPFSYLDISNTSVATSGNYEKFAIIQGKRYSHTIDPKTGYPVSGIKSVTIITPNAELADALTTPIMVMGVRVGLALINQMQQMACVIIDDKDQLHTSHTIQIKNSR